MTTPSEPSSTEPRVPSRRSDKPDNESTSASIQAAVLQSMNDQELMGLATVISSVIEQHSGPLPSPRILAEYEKVMPGSAREIMDVFLQQSAHRIAMETAMVEGENRRADWGVIAAFVLSVLAFGLALVLAYLGSPTAGAIVAALQIAALAGIFVYGTAVRRREREEERRGEAKGK